MSANSYSISIFRPQHHRPDAHDQLNWPITSRFPSLSCRWHPSPSVAVVCSTIRAYTQRCLCRLSHSNFEITLQLKIARCDSAATRRLPTPSSSLQPCLAGAVSLRIQRGFVP
ncbi:hypothetical protein R3P38DRAFT_3175488 [Favolaschia claudopus]|uniref:Uncharacterized protein n=1 Tax=Favolaschia claudopus TaxID=2862362 RepID=A0AAW0D5P9_9AGAR